MAANVAPVSYALVAKKAAGTSEENDSTNTMSEIPVNPENQAENNPKMEQKKKRNSKRRDKAAKKAVSKSCFYFIFITDRSLF